MQLRRQLRRLKKIDGVQEKDEQLERGRAEDCPHPRQDAAGRPRQVDMTSASTTLTTVARGGVRAGWRIACASAQRTKDHMHQTIEAEAPAECSKNGGTERVPQGTEVQVQACSRKEVMVDTCGKGG